MKPQADSGVEVAGERDALARAIEAGTFDEFLGVWDPWHGSEVATYAPERRALERAEALVGRELTTSDTGSLRKRLPSARLDARVADISFMLHRAVQNRKRDRVGA